MILFDLLIEIELVSMFEEGSGVFLLVSSFFFNREIAI